MRSSLVLVQYRKNSQYNDFIGDYYHFPKSYLSQFKDLPLEFIYFEPEKTGDGVYYGYGKIEQPPFEDKREPDHFFVKISEYKSFSSPVHFKQDGVVREKPPHYNPQNAVRRIQPEVLDEICLDGGIILNFKADAHLVKVLGEQLIASEKVGILELIKNAYDAQATQCKVRIEKIPSIQTETEPDYLFDKYEGPVIVVEDNGAGMSREVIENGWLRPASTLKTTIKEKLKREKERAIETGTLGTYENLVSQLKSEYNGRIPLGEKGVGRLATNRLGRNLIIKTKIKELEYEFLLRVNWDAFEQNYEKAVDLDSIGVVLTKQPPSRDYGETKSGTQIIVYGGKDGFSLSKEAIEDINKSILRLNSPNPNPQRVKSTFSVAFDCPQLSDLPKTQIYERFTPTFSFDALVNGKGVIDTYTLKFDPPKSVPMPPDEKSGENYDLKAAAITHWKTDSGAIREPQCGAFFIHLEIWYRAKPWIDGPEQQEMKDYLYEYGGISIYRDDLIIFPAESGTKNDWLNLSKRHIKQGFRVSYYNFIGNIEIEQTENILLIDKTDREAMLNNTAFKDLAKLVETAIENICEIEFIAKRDAFSNLTKGITRDPKILTQTTKQSAIIIGNLAENYPVEQDPYIILKEIGKVEERRDRLINLERSIKNLKKSIDIIDEVQDLLTERAGYGLAVAVSVHEIAKITSNFYNGISQLLKSETIDTLKLQDLKDASVSLQSELRRLGPLRAIRNEKPVEFSIMKVIDYCFEIFKRKLKQDFISFEVNDSEDFKVYARYGTLAQVVTNLIDNSIYWLSTTQRPDRRIVVRLNSKQRTVTFADNGPGIAESIRPYMFEAGYSLKVPPSGLGLYICKYYMHAMNGDIYETHQRERIATTSGAEFTLDFEKVPLNKETAK